MYGLDQQPSAAPPPIYGMRPRHTPARPAIYGEAGHRPSAGQRVRCYGVTRGSTTPTSFVRSADAASGSLGLITGYASKFDVWSQITERDATGSIVRYMERVAPGAYAGTVRDPSGVRILYSHGHDPLLGSRPIATLDTLTEDNTGLRYAGRLLDTIAGREVAPMLAAGVLGSSYRFVIDDQHWDDHPGKSSHNPRGLPERTISAATVIEVGPTPFPAQKVTTAALG